MVSVSPVAVTMMSAGNSLPEVNAMPSGVKRSIVSVTISASPLRMVSNRSASGTRQMRWSHGL
jgi:hypothetical protein